MTLTATDFTIAFKIQILKKTCNLSQNLLPSQECRLLCLAHRQGWSDFFRFCFNLSLDYRLQPLQELSNEANGSAKQNAV